MRFCCRLVPDAGAPAVTRRRGAAPNRWARVRRRSTDSSGSRASSATCASAPRAPGRQPGPVDGGAAPQVRSPVTGHRRFGKQVGMTLQRPLQLDQAVGSNSGFYQVSRNGHTETVSTWATPPSANRSTPEAEAAGYRRSVSAAPPQYTSRMERSTKIRRVTVPASP